MTQSDPVRVFLACRNAARLAALFTDERAELVAADSAHDAEIIVADATWGPSSEPAARRISGIIGLGPVNGAEVTLPIDTPSRELATACRLLGEVVRLRRRLESSQQQHDQALEEARTDPLTGLPNRRAWDERLARLTPEDRSPADYCLAIADLDHFKRINDLHTHAIGDAVLRSIAHALRAGLRAQDFVARLGGDEFGILLMRLEDPEAGLVLERVRERVFHAGEAAGLPECSASIGYCVSRLLVDSTPQAIMQAADQALSSAKSAGRDQLVASRTK